MKFSEFSAPKINLSNKPSVSIVTKLKPHDVVIYEGIEYSVEFPPKKVQKGVWWIGLANDRDKKYVKIVENVKPKMTPHEKKTMITNVKGVVKMFGENEQRLIEKIHSYYHNLAVHNNYDDKDVREVMGKFPIPLLRKSGLPI